MSQEFEKYFSSYWDIWLLIADFGHRVLKYILSLNFVSKHFLLERNKIRHIKKFILRSLAFDCRSEHSLRHCWKRHTWGYCAVRRNIRLYHPSPFAFQRSPLGHFLHVFYSGSYVSTWCNPVHLMTAADGGPCPETLNAWTVPVLLYRTAQRAFSCRQQLKIAATVGNHQCFYTDRPVCLLQSMAVLDF